MEEFNETSQKVITNGGQLITVFIWRTGIVSYSVEFVIGRK